MGDNKPDTFSLFVPDEQEPPRELPDRLELEDPRPKKLKFSPLPYGAYNPYENLADETQRRPRPKPRDLRKLSQWIRVTQEVEALRDQSTPDPKLKSR
ncbi:MAG: hypothetical protein RL030_1192 [Pseudomonadota bacterium]